MTGLLIDTEGTDCCCGPPPIFPSCLEFQQDPSVCPTNIGVVNHTGIRILFPGNHLHHVDLFNFGPYIQTFLGFGNWRTPQHPPECFDIGRRISSCPLCQDPTVLDVVICGCTEPGVCLDHYFGQGIPWTTTSAKSIGCILTPNGLSDHWGCETSESFAVSPPQIPDPTLFTNCPGGAAWDVTACGGQFGCVDEGSFTLG